MDRQCSSCGGFCKKSGCEREHVKPKEWVGLTDKETNEIAREWQETPDGLGDLCRAIEAKLKEKNYG